MEVLKITFFIGLLASKTVWSQEVVCTENELGLGLKVVENCRKSIYADRQMTLPVCQTSADCLHLRMPSPSLQSPYTFDVVCKIAEDMLEDCFGHLRVI